MTTKTYRSKPTSMSSHSEMDKKGNLVIQSKKEYANSKDTRIDKITVPKKVLEKMKRLKQNDITEFKDNCYHYCKEIKVTSAAVRTNEANHTRELSHCLRHITHHIGRLDLCKQSGDYGKAAKEKIAKSKVKTSKLVKSKVKAAKVKKATKVKATVKK